MDGDEERGDIHPSPMEGQNESASTYPCATNGDTQNEGDDGETRQTAAQSTDGDEKSKDTRTQSSTGDRESEADYPCSIAVDERNKDCSPHTMGGESTGTDSINESKDICAIATDGSGENKEPCPHVVTGQKESKDTRLLALSEYEDGDDTWTFLPDMLLEDIYTMLTYRQRYYCSMVCKNWYEVFDSPRVWRQFTVGERTFTYRRFNLYKGYQHEISHHRVQMCLGKIGHHARYLTILPIANFFNLYEFMNVLSCYLEFFDEFPMPCLKSFHFTFACESRGLSGSVILGTGGKLLQELKRLLGNLRHVEQLTINQLLLDNKEVAGLLESFWENCNDTLTYLEVLNCTKNRCPFYYSAMFPNLNKLVITPMQLTNEVVEMLAQNSNLVELVIVQDPYSGENLEPVHSHTWWEVKQTAPNLKVRLEVRGYVFHDLLIQENAPVTAVVYDAPHSLAKAHTILSLLDQYSHTLKTYGHLGLPRQHGSRSFHERGDSALILLVSECKNLKTLVINERISTATLLLIVSKAKSLKNLYVRRNALLLKSDWPKSPEWSDEFYMWLHKTSRSYFQTEMEVSTILNLPRWKLLTDQEFKRLKI